MAQEIAINIGKDEEGNLFDLPITASPHCLLGGTTGSGKTTLLHNIITTLIGAYSEKELKIFACDPKKIEFSRYNRSPMVKVARDLPEMERMLQKVVKIINKRFDLLDKCTDEAGLPIVDAFQKTILCHDENGINQFNFPNIVVIIDELGHLVLDKQYGKNILEHIVTGVQIGRGVAVNYIICTQHPVSKIVSTALKSCCPTRIAMRVASRINSRVILDCSGAEQIREKGMAIVSSPVIDKMTRVQCRNVDFDYVEHIIQASVLGKPLFSQLDLLSKESETNGSDPEKCKIYDFQSQKLFPGFSVTNGSGSKFISLN